LSITIGLQVRILQTINASRQSAQSERAKVCAQFRINVRILLVTLREGLG
jgi:hypothetical protein